jgi:hypothetical protein
VAEPVEIRQRLQIGFVLDKFFSAATEQADVGIDALDHLAVKSRTRRNTPCAAGCCGPKLIVKLRSAASAMRTSFASLELKRPGTFICSANAPTGGTYEVWSCLLRDRNDADAALQR